MRALSVDTTLDAQRKQFELMRGLSPSQKLLADLHHRFPQADPIEIRRRFIARVLPREDVIRVYGFDPSAEGYRPMVLPMPKPRSFASKFILFSPGFSRV